MNVKNFLSTVLSVFVFLSRTAAEELKYSNPVLHGDFPDPSIIRVGEEYWATATTSEWAPLFPLIRSRDLVHWEVQGAVFQNRPDWSNGNYWAPEISEYRGRYYVYYVGHKKGGSLNIAVATANNPRGPWTDHGPMIGQEAGSIDPMPVLDENGERYLVWKEDGNSRKKPTPIWAQKLSDDGTKLVGEMKELIRNDVPWEANLVEGPFVLRHGEWFYLFYSGAGCCGRNCTYGVGVARAKKLLGPWEKNPANPILIGDEKFRCPGHGSLITAKTEKTFFLYHAYDAKNFVYVGRQGMLDEVLWDTNSNWPTITGGGPSSSAIAPQKSSGVPMALDFTDEFNSTKLHPRWQWPQAIVPVVRLQKGELQLSPVPGREKDLLGAILAVQTTTGDYTATVAVDCEGLNGGAATGLFAFGDENNALGVYFQHGKINLLQRKKGKDSVLSTVDLPKLPKVFLRMTAHDGHRYKFAVQNGNNWKDIGDKEAEGDYLPPWDRGVRVALTVGGGENVSAKFDSLKVIAMQ